MRRDRSAKPWRIYGAKRANQTQSKMPANQSTLQHEPHRRRPVLFSTAVAWFGCVAMLCGATQSIGCAKYHLGNQYLYRSDIRTVHVMMFETDSNRRYLGQRLTEAVIKNVELNTPLTITDPQIADSFIRGRLTSVKKRVAGENINDEPRTLQIAWVVEVDWVDRAGVPLMQLQSVEFKRDAEFIPEGGQSMATAQQRVIEQVARDVISQMQMPW